MVALTEFLSKASPSDLASLQGVLLLVGVYLASVAVYRLYFHPLAAIPGPKLAALSQWYQAYYNIIKKGHFYDHLDGLHKKYGELLVLLGEFWMAEK